MNKYATGKFIVKVFDEYGTRLDTLYGLETLGQAMDAGKKYDCDSYVVMRVIINSKKVK